MFLLVHKIQWSLTEILIDGWHAVFKNLMIFDWLTTQISTDSNKLDGLFNGWLTFPLVQKKLMIFDWYSRLIWWLINIPSTSKYLMIFDGWLTYSPSDSKKKSFIFKLWSTGSKNVMFHLYSKQLNDFWLVFKIIFNGWNTVQLVQKI